MVAKGRVDAVRPELSLSARKPISMTAIRALLSHPGLDDADTRRALGVVDRQRARRISVGRFMNITRAVSLP